jgi:micrococcal nuclease
MSPQSTKSESQPHIERIEIVSRVIDGDTIQLIGDEKVRLVGIDAPELDSKDPLERGKSIEAREFVNNFCPQGTEVGLDVDDLKKVDRYGRTLAVVYVKNGQVWINLNAELLRLKLAEILYMPPSEFNPYRWLS